MLPVTNEPIVISVASAFLGASGHGLPWQSPHYVDTQAGNFSSVKAENPAKVGCYIHIGVRLSNDSVDNCP